jgi:hypothetical protein
MLSSVHFQVDQHHPMPAKHFCSIFLTSSCYEDVELDIGQEDGTQWNSEKKNTNGLNAQEFSAFVIDVYHTASEMILQVRT